MLMDSLLTNEIQLNWLRTFEAAGKHLSFTIAAKELNMSQSAVSQQIHLLEHHVQQQLFIRANRSIQLTDVGRAFLPLVGDTLRQLNSGSAQIFSQSNEAIVDVSINSTFAVLWLATHLSKFNELNPHIMIRQLGSNWPTDYVTSTAELEVRYGSGNWAGFDSFALVKGELRPYCSKSIVDKIESPADLEDFILLDVMGTPSGWEHWLKSKKLSFDRSYQYQLMDSHVTAVVMAANGAGVCLMYDELMAQGVLADQLVPPFVDRVETKGSYYLCHRSDRRLSDASRIFKHWLLENAFGL